ncbi:antitoxin [Kocuria arenosa]|uniref:antitoxin n=1 Tax=Kocuria arenosa TaxID=3071446 RepID=UPI0034D5438A
MVNFKGLTAKAKQLAQRNPDKVDKVLDQAGRFVDKRTGRKYERHVGTVQQKARQFLGGGPTTGGPTTGGPTPGERLDGQPGGPAATDRPGDVPGHEGQGPGPRL